MERHGEAHGVHTRSEANRQVHQGPLQCSYTSG
eukprot:COSAG01_NODE_39867_length_471_cov_0.701613_1_plen_32_part_01